MLKKKADRWIKALRSGKFKQATGALLKRENDEPEGALIGHCCLGVLGAICGAKEEVLLGSSLLGDVCGISEDYFGLKKDDGNPVDENGDELAGTVVFKVRGEKKRFNSLAEANDEGVTFKRIARRIEKNYKRL